MVKRGIFIPKRYGADEASASFGRELHGAARAGGRGGRHGRQRMEVGGVGVEAHLAGPLRPEGLLQRPLRDHLILPLRHGTHQRAAYHLLLWPCRATQSYLRLTQRLGPQGRHIPRSQRRGHLPGSRLG